MNEKSTPNEYRTGTHLIAVARGIEPADLVIRDCVVLNVYTRQLLQHRNVGVAGAFIAYVSSGEMPIGPATRIMEGKGRFLVPGFIDSHAHLDEGVVTIPEFLRYGTAGGTTAFVTDAMEVANSMGSDGVAWFYESCRNQPAHIFLLAPTMVPGDPSVFPGHRLSTEDMERFLALPEVLGLGESYWTQVLADPGRFLPLFKRAIELGKTVEGHGSGAHGVKLEALAASGATSCHEAISVEDVTERLEAGLFTILREGSIRQELEALAPVASMDIDFRNLGLCTDGINPPDLLEYGYMEHVVQRAIDVGFDPITAIQMATINNATHFHMDHRLGSISPGRWADFMLLSSLTNIKAEAVVCKGKVIARNGKSIVTPRPYSYPRQVAHALQFDRRITPYDLRLEVPENRQAVTARVIHQLNDVTTGNTTRELAVSNGKPLLGEGVNKAGALSTIDSSQLGVGLISGWNLREGACASSATWDAPHIAGVGATDEELTYAMNRVAEMGGGIVVCRGQKSVVELPLPIGGIICELPLEETADRMTQANQVLRDMGYPYQNPLLALRVLANVGVPHLRLGGLGLMSITSRGVIPVSLFL